jgi:hypothetical protein
MPKITKFVHYQHDTSQDERQFLIRCVNILTLVTNVNMFLYCMAWGVQERAKLLSNFWKTPKPTNGMILPKYLKNNF